VPPTRPAKKPQKVIFGYQRLSSSALRRAAPKPPIGQEK
jgi:hypothetical protein